MTDIRFTPQAWDDGARRVSASAQDFASAAQSILSQCSDLGRLGCNDGGTLADAALGMIFPALFRAVGETIRGLSQGLSEEAQNMQVTGANYRETETANAALASAINGG